LRQILDRAVGSAAAAAEEVDVGADFGEGVAGGVDAWDSGDWVEDDLAEFGVEFVGTFGDGQRAERELLAIFGPDLGGVGHVIARLRQLDEDLELDRGFSQTL
jgi:hypothetical protein